MIVIFDIDGVLADATHRQHFVERRPKDWDAFFAAVGMDPVIEAGRTRLLAESEHAEVVLASGRPESTRDATQAWLSAHGMGEPRLVLRPDSDHRPAADLKADLVRSLGSPVDIALVIDDDISVLRQLEGLGYRTELFR
jgi:phosphoglycolate phosphatase-like HAD superfamily hydrolase